MSNKYQKAHKPRRVVEAGEMAQWSGALATTGEELGPVLTSLTPVLETMKPSPDLCGHQACMWYTYIHASKIYTYIK